MHHTASLILFILLSHHHLPRTTAEPEEQQETPSHTNYCGWIKVMANQEETHYSFLRKSSSSSSSSSPSVRLYHSVWSTEERAPLGCAWSDDAAVIDHYLALCAVEERSSSSSEFTQHHHHDGPFDLSLLFDGDRDGMMMMCVDSTTSMITAGREEEEEDEGWKTGAHWGQQRRMARSVAEMNGLHATHTTGGHQRVKRGFIVPGTLWCGSGNKAPSYADLGVFSDTDGCCREHDQCKDTILSFQSSWGVFNSNIFTMSHCDCDKKFRSCLAAANDSISDVVGYTFFNVLKLNCFEFALGLQCTQRNWFGRCKENKMAPYAVVHQATQYGGDESSSDNNTTTTTHFNISTVISATFSTQGQVSTGGQEENSSTSQPGSVISGTFSTQGRDTTGGQENSSTSQLGSVISGTFSTQGRVTTGGQEENRSTSQLGSVISGTFSTQGRVTTGGQEENSSTSQPGSVSLSGRTASSSTFVVPAVSLTSSTARSTPMSTPARTSTGLDNVSAGGPRIVTPSPPHTVRLSVSNGLTRSQTQQDTSANTGKPLSCEIFMELDGCKFKIFPQQRKYGLHNQESRTLYHCNCTTRLFQSLARQEETTVIRALLLDYVSDSCFLTQEACSQGKNCSAAAVVKLAALPPQLKKPSSGIMEAGRPLEAIRLKVRKQPNSRRAKRKDRPVRLQKLCVRMSNMNNRPKQPSKNTKVHSTEEDR